MLCGIFSPLNSFVNIFYIFVEVRNLFYGISRKQFVNRLLKKIGNFFQVIMEKYCKFLQRSQKRIAIYFNLALKKPPQIPTIALKIIITIINQCCPSQSKIFDFSKRLLKKIMNFLKWLPKKIVNFYHSVAEKSRILINNWEKIWWILPKMCLGCRVL